jgi:tripartite-type tricarboxylate transporter receptor subunit TctC
MHASTATRMFVAAALAANAGWALAQAGAAKLADPYPSRPVHVLMGLAPGGATDIQARRFSQKMTEDLKQPFVVENRPGVGEVLAIQAVTGAAPDGHMIFAGTPGITIFPAFQDKPSYDPVNDFAPVSLITLAPYMLVVHPSVPAKTVRELVEFSKTVPGGLNWGTGGAATPLHLGGAWIANVTGAKITLVPYKGTGPVLNDLVGGRLHATTGNPISTMPHVKAGKLRLLAVTTVKRAKAYPDVPTVAESGIGIPDFDTGTWHGWLTTKGTPTAVVNRLSAALSKMVNAPDMVAALLADGGEAVGSTPAEFQKMIAAEAPRWRKLVKDTGARLE